MLTSKLLTAGVHGFIHVNSALQAAGRMTLVGHTTINGQPEL